jgi:hypothetical protein
VHNISNPRTGVSPPAFNMTPTLPTGTYGRAHVGAPLIALAVNRLGIPSEYMWPAPTSAGQFSAPLSPSTGTQASSAGIVAIVYGTMWSVVCLGGKCLAAGSVALTWYRRG